LPFSAGVYFKKKAKDQNQCVKFLLFAFAKMFNNLGWLVLLSFFFWGREYGVCRPSTANCARKLSAFSPFWELSLSISRL